MSNNNGRISAPVGIDDIRRTLGANTTDLGQLCKHPNINMWAKYKPTRYEGSGPTTVSSNPIANLEAFQALQYKAGGDCGIDVPIQGSLEHALALKDNKLNGWSYVRPSGGPSSPYRQGDFHRYLHTASPPLTGFYCDSQTVNEKIHITGALNMQSGNTLSLAIGDISSLDGFGIGVLITDKNGKQVPCISDDDSSVLDVWLDCKQKALAEGTCTAYPFLTNGRMYALIPYATELSFEYMTKVTQLQISWNVSGGDVNTHFDIDLMSIDYTFYIINNGAGSYDFTNCTMYIIAPVNIDEYIKNGTTGIRGNTSKNLGTISVPQGTTKTITGSVLCNSIWNDLESVRNGNVYKECYIVLKIGNAQNVYTAPTYNLVQFLRTANSNDNVGSGGNGSRT